MAEMKILFIGVARRHGTSAKTGNSYDICELHHAWPLVAKNTDNYRYLVHGYEQREMKLLPESFNDFENVELGEEITVSLVPDPDNPMRNVCNGLV